VSDQDDENEDQEADTADHQQGLIRVLPHENAFRWLFGIVEDRRGGVRRVAVNDCLGAFLSNVSTLAKADRPTRMQEMTAMVTSKLFWSSS
jgi:hypothetical protein